MLVQAALNGPFTKADHPAVPVTAQELAGDAAACVAAGAGAIHLHPRDRDGRERLDALIGGWTEPDHASVNVSEDGAFEVMRALSARGIGIEAGVWSAHDAHALRESGLAGDLTRILVEPVAADPATAVALVERIHRELTGIAAPRLQHGDGAATWVLLADAAARGADTRIGLEDVHDGAGGNEALVRRAMSLLCGGRQQGQRNDPGGAGR